MLRPTPDSSELRRVLRHATTMLAASDLETPQRVVVIQRARLHLREALRGIDRLVRDLTDAVPVAIEDAPTDRHTAIEIELPTLLLPWRLRR